jgi:hypothetical protein
MAEAARLLPQAIIIRRKIQTKWNLRGFKFGGGGKLLGREIVWDRWLSCFK